MRHLKLLHIRENLTTFHFWSAQQEGEGKGSENQSTPLSACGPSASHRLVVHSLPLLKSSHKSIDVSDVEAGFDC